MTSFITNFAIGCTPKGDFFGFPAWYKYLDSITDVDGNCLTRIHGLNDIWLIMAAILELLLRVAAIAALIFVVWGGIQYIASQGEPDKTAKAQGTIVNALIGLVISISAATAVSFVAGKF